MSRHEHTHKHRKQQQKFISVEFRGPFIFVVSTASVLYGKNGLQRQDEYNRIWEVYMAIIIVKYLI